MKDALGKYLQNVRINVVLPHIQGRLLDIGCGYNLLVKTYGDGVGVDVYPWEGADLVVDNTAHLPYPERSFDTITILAALNHIPNREEVLAECRRLLKQDGRLIVTMIPPGLSRVWHFLRSPWDNDQHERGMKSGEVFGFTRKEMLGLFERAGFKCEFSQGFSLVNRVYIAHLS